MIPLHLTIILLAAEYYNYHDNHHKDHLAPDSESRCVSSHLFSEVSVLTVYLLLHAWLNTCESVLEQIIYSMTTTKT